MEKLTIYSDWYVYLYFKISNTKIMFAITKETVYMIQCFYPLMKMNFSI